MRRAAGREKPAEAKIKVRPQKSVPSCSPKRKPSGTLAKFYVRYFNSFSYRRPRFAARTAEGFSNSGVARGRRWRGAQRSPWGSCFPSRDGANARVYKVTLLKKYHRQHKPGSPTPQSLFCNFLETTYKNFLPQSLCVLTQHIRGGISIHVVVILGFTHRTFRLAVYFAVCKLFIGRKTFYKSIDLKYQTFNPGLLFFYIRAYVSRPDCSSRLQSEKLKASSFPAPVPSPTLEWTKGLRCHSSLFSLDHPQSPAGSYCFCPHLAFSMSFWGSRSKTHPGS